MSQYRGFGGDDLPDPRQLLEQVKRNLKYIIGGAAVLIGVILVSMSVYTVEPEEQAVVLRFGRPIGTFDPGLHFKLPIVDQVHIVPVERQHRIEIGFRSEPGKETTVYEKGYDRESLMLTGDLSLAHVRWSVIYKVKNIEHYLFNIQDPEENVRDVAKGVMRNVIGDYSLDEVLTGKYEEIADEAKRLTQAALDEVQSGVQVSAVALQKTEVPPEAKEAFDDLNRSVAQVKRQIVEAYARRKQVRGEAEQRRQTEIGEAEARRSLIVENANGEAEAFLAKLAQYELAPKVNQNWLYLEAMTEILPNVEEKIVIEELEGSDELVRLLMASLVSANPLTVKPPPPPPPAPTPAVGPPGDNGARVTSGGGQ